MIRQTLRRHGRLLAWLYLVELGVASIVTLAVGWTFGEVFAERPIFDRGVAGDLAALALSFQGRTGVVVALACAGVAVLLFWAVFSWYLGAGLLGVFAGRAFGETAASRFWSFARLSLWTLVPWGIAFFLVALGLGAFGEHILEVQTWGGFFGAIVLHLLPGILAVALCACVVDHARVLLVTDPGPQPSAGRALAGAFRLVLRRPAPYGRFLLYLAFWAAVSLLYLAVTSGRAYAGPAGAVALFLIWQVTLGLRFVGRATLSASQVAYVTERAGPPAP